MLCHERSFLSGSGLDIKTTGYYNSSPISFYRFWMLKYLQNRCLRPKYRFYTSFYRTVDFFFEFFCVPGIILDHSIHIDHSRPFYTHSIHKKSKTRRGVRAGRSAFLIFFTQFYKLKKKSKKQKQIKNKSKIDFRPTFKETYF